MPALQLSLLSLQTHYQKDELQAHPFQTGLLREWLHEYNWTYQLEIKNEHLPWQAPI